MKTFAWLLPLVLCLWSGPAGADATASTWTREVLVTQAGVCLNRVKTSATIEITNRGPNPIWCSIGKLASAIVNKSKKIAALADAPQNAWAVDLPDTVDICCKAETADQIADAATVINEAPR